MQQQFLWRLFEEIEAVDLTTVPEPKGEVEEGEQVVGVLPEYLRQFYVVYYAYRDELDKQSKQVSVFAKVMSMFGPYAPEYFAARKKYKLVRNLFLYSIEEAFPELIHRSIGFRERWQVVAVSSIFDMFKGPLSGGMLHM